MLGKNDALLDLCAFSEEWSKQKRVFAIFWEVADMAETHVSVKKISEKLYVLLEVQFCIYSTFENM